MSDGRTSWPLFSSYCHSLHITGIQQPQADDNARVIRSILFLNVQLDDRLIEGGEELRAGRRCFHWASSVIFGWASLTAKEHGIAALPVALLFDVTTYVNFSCVSMSLIPLQKKRRDLNSLKNKTLGFRDRRLNELKGSTSRHARKQPARSIESSSPARRYVTTVT